MKVCWVGVYLSAIQKRLTATPCIDTNSLLHVHHQDESVQEEVKNLEELNWAAVAGMAALFIILILYAIAKKTCFRQLDLPSSLMNEQLAANRPANEQLAANEPANEQLAANKQQNNGEPAPPKTILKTRLRNSIGYYLPKEVMKFGRIVSDCYKMNTRI